VNAGRVKVDTPRLDKNSSSSTKKDSLNSNDCQKPRLAMLRCYTAHSFSSVECARHHLFWRFFFFFSNWIADMKYWAANGVFHSITSYWPYIISSDLRHADYTTEEEKAINKMRFTKVRLLFSSILPKQLSLHHVFSSSEPGRHV
jgi:hypothetical protein